MNSLLAGPEIIRSHIRAVPDFPQPGITFLDITDILSNGPVFSAALEFLGDIATSFGPCDVIVGLEARGFILGSPLAHRLGVGFVPLRKSGKLPPPVYQTQYELEYGQAGLEMSSRAIRPGARVLIVDDVLATGGTVAAGADLVERAGGQVVGIALLLEIGGLDGRERLKDYPVHSVVAVHT